jgi:hypothetical protein
MLRDPNFRVIFAVEEHDLVTATTAETAERVIATVRSHKAELRASGIRHLSLFGSRARGDANYASDRTW